MSKTRSYKLHLNDRLKEPSEAAGYLNAALEEDDLDVFLLALKDVADAMGGMTLLSNKSDLNRQSLYRSLAKSGNPKLLSILTILTSMGLEIHIKPAA